MKPVEISIVVPVFNSEETLAELSNKVASALADVNYELILVNDKSVDNSWQKITEICSANSNVKGITLKKNSGQDNAILAGLSNARGQYIVIMDDDLQHSPDDIRVLHKTCSKGYDVCYAHFQEKKQQFWKNIGSSFNGYIAELLLKKPKSLYLSPFKILNRSTVDEVIKFNGPFAYVDGIILSVTSNIGQIYLKHNIRSQGKSNYNFVKSVSVFLKHVTGYSLYPLRFATIVGMFASSLSFLLGIYFVVDYLTNERRVEGWLTLVLLIVFFNGLILMCLGLIGEYIGRIYLTVTSKPKFVIEKIICHSVD